MFSEKDPFFGPRPFPAQVSEVPCCPLISRPARFAHGLRSPEAASGPASPRPNLACSAPPSTPITDSGPRIVIPYLRREQQGLHRAAVSTWDTPP
jgi:hypothetical protein